jgi:hypothetical protein
VRTIADARRRHFHEGFSFREGFSSNTTKNLRDHGTLGSFGGAPLLYCLDMRRLGAYACYVSMAEINRYGRERLLLGDGTGVECVSPLRAVSGRFQAMTSGR